MKKVSMLRSKEWDGRSIYRVLYDLFSKSSLSIPHIISSDQRARKKIEKALYIEHIQIFTIKKNIDFVIKFLSPFVIRRIGRSSPLIFTP